MKKILSVPLVITLLIVPIYILASSIPTASAKTINLRFANYSPADSDVGVLYKNFCQEVGKRSEGKLKITYFPGGSLINSKGSPDAVLNGIVDIAYCGPSHNPGRFPLTEIFATMMGFPTAYVASHVADDYVRHKIPKAKELDDYKILLTGAFSPMVIYSNTPITTMDGFKGLKIRARGTAADTVNSWGSIPVSMPIGDCYDALTKGVIDGIATALEAGQNWRIGEATKYCTLTWQIFTPPIFWVMMNKSVYDGLPADLKTILDEVSLEWVQKEALVFNNMDINAAKFCKERGVEFINMSKEDAMKGQAATKGILDDYVQSMIDKGHKDAKGYVDYLVSRTDYWLQQQIKNGVKSPMGPEEVLIPGLMKD